MQVIDISNTQSPQIVGSVSTQGIATGVAIAGTYAYVADWESGLQIIDNSSPQNPQIVGSVDTPGSATNVAVAGTYAYVTEWNAGVQVVDISTPQNPRIVASVGTSRWSDGVTIKGSYAYVAGSGVGLEVIDISNPQSPQVVGSVLTPGDARSVAIAGDYAYVAVNSPHSGLQVIDISNAQDPRVVGSVDAPAWCENVTITGNYAYIAERYAGVQVVDISNPLIPRVIGSVRTTSGAFAVAVAGACAYVANMYDGLQVLPAQCDSGTPVFLEAFNLDPSRGFVAVSWRVASAGESVFFRLVGSNGLQEWEVPHRSGVDGSSYAAEDRSGWLGSGSDITYRLFLSNDGQTWNLLGVASTSLLAPTAVTRIVSVCPNPLNPRTTIAFTCRKAGQVQLAIHDLAGRRVVVLVNGQIGAGLHEVTWDGHDGAGKSVAAGQYLARMEADGRVDVQKLLLVR